jgi:hypothetical protein
MFRQTGRQLPSNRETEIGNRSNHLSVARDARTIAPVLIVYRND